MAWLSQSFLAVVLTALQFPAMIFCRTGSELKEWNGIVCYHCVGSVNIALVDWSIEIKIVAKKKGSNRRTRT